MLIGNGGVLAVVNLEKNEVVEVVEVAEVVEANDK
jgi:hypothetical protein